MYNRFYILLLSFICFSWCACSSVARREARHTINLADSLRAEGVPYDDSAAIAGSVATLNHYRLFLPTDYAKANYYYGRLLRSRGHYPEAMRCFINAVNSYSNDYIILGRIWSNIGLMCRQEGNYDLAYKVYKTTVDYFKKGKDSTAYYYAINNMALQCAMQKDKLQTYELLSIIEHECKDTAVLTKILETRATACKHIGEYDSVLYYVNQLHKKGFQERAELVLKAQAFMRTQNQDSAIFYAEMVLHSKCTKNDSVNMLYILSHDQKINGDSILILATERADRQREYTISQEKLSHAVEILTQNMIPDYKWVYGVIVTIIIIGIILLAILWSTKKYRAFQRAQLKHIKEQKALVEAEHNILVYQNNDLKDRSAKQRENIQTQFENNCIAFRNSQNLKKDLSWNNYDRMCEIVDERLFLLANKLKQQNMLTEKELRLCILEAIRIPQKQIAEILPYAPSGIGKFKYTTAKKLNVTSKNMRNFLIALAIGDEKITVSS